MNALLRIMGYLITSRVSCWRFTAGLLICKHKSNSVSMWWTPSDYTIFNSFLRMDANCFFIKSVCHLTVIHNWFEMDSWLACLVVILNKGLEVCVVISLQSLALHAIDFLKFSNKCLLEFQYWTFPASYIGRLNALVSC